MWLKNRGVEKSFCGLCVFALGAFVMFPLACVAKLTAASIAPSNFLGWVRYPARCAPYLRRAFPDLIRKGAFLWFLGCLHYGLCLTRIGSASRHGGTRRFVDPFWGFQYFLFDYVKCRASGIGLCIHYLKDLGFFMSGNKKRGWEVVCLHCASLDWCWFYMVWSAPLPDF